MGAPRAFAVFGDDAGRYVNDVFPRYYTVGVVLGVIALLSGLGRGALDGFETYHRQSVLLNGGAMLAVAIGLVASHLG